jgi:DNA-binding PadR family transcriptional regulator
MQVIIFKNGGEGVSVIYPTLEVLQKHSIEDIAKKDVPTGKPYKIIDASELPSREQRNQWDVDEADLTDGVGSESNEFN